MWLMKKCATYEAIRHTAVNTANNSNCKVAKQISFAMLYPTCKRFDQLDDMVQQQIVGCYQEDEKRHSFRSSSLPNLEVLYPLLHTEDMPFLWASHLPTKHFYGS